MNVPAHVRALVNLMNNPIVRFVRQRWRLLLGILVSVLSLYLVVRGTDWVKLWAVFRTANYWWLIPAALVLLSTSIPRAFRWKLLIAPDAPITIPRLVHIVNIGYLFNNTLPAKVGELVRAYLVGRSVEGGFAQALSTLLVERLLDVLCVVVILLILLPFIAMPDWAMRGGLIFGTVAVAGMAVLVVLAKLGEPGIDKLWRVLGKVPVLGSAKVRAFVSRLVVGLQPITQPRLAPGILFWSAMLWLGYALLNYLVLAAFRMTNQVSFALTAFVLVATGFSMIIPSSPGAMGVFEGAVVLALGLYNVDQSQAFAYGFGLHMFTNLLLIVFGLVGLRAESLSFGQVSSGISQAQPDTPSEEA